MAQILHFPKRRRVVDNGPRALYVWPGTGRMKNPFVVVFDQVRRQFDYLGGIGFRLKRGLTDRKIQKDGYIRVMFPTRALAKKFQRRVERYCDDSLVVERRRLKVAA